MDEEEEHTARHLQRVVRAEPKHRVCQLLRPKHPRSYAVHVVLFQRCAHDGQHLLPLTEHDGLRRGVMSANARNTRMDNK
jgi:hypothetical protein